MNAWKFTTLLGDDGGMVAPDAYNTAWVARVPAAGDLRQPAWPQALAYLRAHQLADGGWGAPNVYYAHERTISTLAALLAFLEWGTPEDEAIIAGGIAALHDYAIDMADEPHEPIGFELLLPRLAVEVGRHDVTLPAGAWSDIERMATEKVALIGGLEIDYERPRSWWFSMEVLLEYQLAEADERILNRHGAVAISPAATAAYLRALRLAGRDSPRAAAFLDRVVRLSGNGAGVCYPIEGFEIIWTLDSYMRAGADPNDPRLKPMLQWLADYWERTDDGLSFSQAFPIADGDDTAVGYTVLRWAGFDPSDEPLRRFWDPERFYFYTYADERSPSASVNVHALLALRQDGQNGSHRRMAAQVTEWLRDRIEEDGALRDKWHISPLYATARAVPALAGWDDGLARRCIDFIVRSQHADGGWGCAGETTLEETAFAVLGLVAGRQEGLLADDGPLRRAARCLARHAGEKPSARLWIGKALYQPIGVVRALGDAAHLALRREGFSVPARRPRPGRGVGQHTATWASSD